ncbi:galactokinase [bacterium]|nr:MAG: galactokinase [bacterium]
MSPAEIRQRFVEKFGHEPAVVAVAPGRINLIGEHTDYNDGFVFPVAIDRQMWIAASPAPGSSRVWADEIGDAAPFDLGRVQPGEIKDWGKYPAGMGWAIRGSGRYAGNVEAVVSSDIPMGSGVSSSAALEMAFGQVWNALGELGISNPELAGLGKVCENRFVGVNSGIMDQMASAMGRDGQAMFLDTRSLKIDYAPVPSGLSVVLCDTKKPRALTDSAYNERRSQCEEAARALGVPALRDATMADLDAKKEDLSDVVYRRAKHVITENERCVRFRDSLAAGDLAVIGELMKASHVSLRDDYEVSCPELDRMAEAAWGAPGCVGARMTGAGFGGACVALVHTERVDEFVKATLAAYDAATGLGGEAMACSVVDGARVVS